MKDIDIVIPWVDGADRAWLKEKEKYSGDAYSDDSIVRYRDWDNLKYLFRSIDQFLPFVRKVHFVTWGHIPYFLNVNCKKLNIVKHSDYIPKEYLPTFSSHVIELNLHRIPDLAEHFIYLNDDMFFLKPQQKEFYFKDNLPVDLCMEIPHQFFSGQIDYIIGSNLAVINENFDKKTAIAKNKSKWYSLKLGKVALKNMYMRPFATFCGFYNHHVASPYLKSTFETVWQTVPDVMDKTCRDKFRQSENVNQWLFRYWQFASGTFSPTKQAKGKLFTIGKDDVQIKDAIVSRRYNCICLSDDDKNIDFEVEKHNINKLLEGILPDKSSFEV